MVTAKAKAKAKKQPTIYDVAVKAGVSKSLVSLVLRGEPGVSESRRVAVLKAIEKLGYKPSRFAQQLAGGRTRTVGAVITDYKNLSYIGFLRGLREVFDDAGYQVIVSDLHNSPQFGDNPISALLSMKVDGLVIAAEVPELLDQEINVPVATIGARGFIFPGSDVIRSDDAYGMKLAIDHLVSLGHKNIVHMTGAGGIAVKRKNAYIKLMNELGLEPVVVGQGKPTTEIGGYLTAKEMLESGIKFTAVSTCNDSMAAGVWSALRENNLRVPEDISVIGYDNTPIASEHFLKLSTIDDVGIMIGRETAVILLERMSGTSAKKPVELAFKPAIVERSTTARVKRSK